MTELKPTEGPVRDKSLQNEDTYANIAGRISKNSELFYAFVFPTFFSVLVLFLQFK